MIYDVAIIGAGIFGIELGLLLARKNLKVIILEKENNICMRASANNQARVHNGYHYPRSRETLVASHRHYNRFLREFHDCINSDFTNLYVLAKDSQVSSENFKALCDHHGLYCKEVNSLYKEYFNFDLIDDVYLSQELVFDINKIRNKLLEQLMEAGIELRLNTRIEDLDIAPIIKLSSANESFTCKQVFNVTYASINNLLKKQDFEIFRLKYELAEICLVDVPKELQQLGVTIMDGPFSSILPFPTTKQHSLSHVKYSSHIKCYAKDGLPPSYEMIPEKLSSNFDLMKNDIARFIPALSKMQYQESFYETKALLEAHEIDDGRPILIKQHCDNFSSILGSKMDNIYDLELQLDNVLDCQMH
ncbi:MAG: FAD-dependent oxidoreductase [Candidatus Melainabacteria bacterium]|jgi:glycine/D-amino acid oxidase-like deaminating enzyme|nr:FAD-dependent oxidoreductase [Candidatus Melainabacteria bacterium]